VLHYFSEIVGCGYGLASSIESQCGTKGTGPRSLQAVSHNEQMRLARVDW